MTENSVLDPEMDVILSNPPSIIRNSAVVIIIRFTTLIIGFISLAAGAGLMISSMMQQEIVDVIFIDAVFQYSGPEAAQIERISHIMGAGFIVLGLLLIIMSWLTKMILRRNLFIIQAFVRWEEIKKGV